MRHALARTGRLEEGDLAFRLERDDLAQVVATDRGFTHEVGSAFLNNFTTGAETWNEEQARVACFEFKTLPRLSARQPRFAFRVYRKNRG